MLFNSHIFIFLFLPITLFVYYRLGGMGQSRAAISWLVAASLFFYGWWNPKYLLLILLSILVNYGIGLILTRNNKDRKTATYLIIGILFNIGLLAYYKYANFFVQNVNTLLNTQFHLETIILPLAISFFTFQQITYIVDAWRGETHEYDFLQYCLFVTFFPQLIAGPIVHHKEMLPQFYKEKTFRFSHENLSIGLSIFIIGLAKKVLIADYFAAYATPVFNASQSGAAIGFLEAWGGALAYTIQLYFDFSGYSDMAIGLARMFGIRLPLNFHSPYKASSIIDFWRRWHITLSRFLKDYVYIPLGGNRSGKTRRYINLLITMLLGGLWHGAGWTFVIWGALHGFYLIINHAFRHLRKNLGQNSEINSLPGKILSTLLTFIAVVIGWVFFRASDMQSAMNIIHGMSGANGILLPESWYNLFGNISYARYGVSDFNVITKLDDILAILILVWAFPNTQQIMINFKPAFETFRGEINRHYMHLLEWKPAPIWAFSIAVLATLSIINLSRISEFLYFQF